MSGAVVDDRFYQSHPKTIRQLASLAGTTVDDAVADRLISSVASAAAAGAEDLVFIEKASQLDKIAAGLCVAPVGVGDATSSTVVIESQHPRALFAALVREVVSPKWGWDGAAQISDSARIEAGSQIAPGVSIAAGVEIGTGTRIEPGVVIGPGCTIGRNCHIAANVTLQFCLVGDNVSIQPGVSVGQDGFNLSPGSGGLIETPHFGRVIIQDDVLIGANCAIDRGLFDDTVIAQGAKIDNLCHFAHNVQIGAHAVVAASAGIAGSAVIEQGVMMGGRVGIADHIRIGAGAKLAANSGHMKDVPAGETWGGYPAKPINTWLRETAWLTRAVSGKSKK